MTPPRWFPPLLLLLVLARVSCDGAVPRSHRRRRLNDTDYDVVIVGAGASGCVVAERLSRRPDLRVLVLEAGLATTTREGLARSSSDWLQLGADGELRAASPPSVRLPSVSAWAETPGAAESMDVRTLSRWDVPGEYENIAWNATFANPITQPFFQGSGIGGGGAVNGMLWTRVPDDTLDDDYPPQFNATSLAPSFDHLLRELPLTQYPSADGVQWCGSVGEILMTSLEQEMGFERRSASPWSGRQDIASTGGAPYVVSAAGERKNSATELLAKANERANTDVVVGVEVLRLLYKQDGTVTGLEYRRNSGSAANDDDDDTIVAPTHTLHLRRGGRIVLAAGALASPRLLLRSGIGPLDKLAALAEQGSLPESVVASSASWRRNDGVGARLQDHVLTRLRFSLDSREDAFDPKAYDTVQSIEARKLYLQSRSGPFSQYGPVLAAYLQTSSSSSQRANVEVFTQPACWGGLCGDESNDLSELPTQEVDVFLMLMEVNSSSSLTLVEADGKPFPESYGDVYLSDETDKAALVEATMRVGEALLSSEAGKAANLSAVSPRAYDETTAKAHVLGKWGVWSHMQASHFSGTCALGPEGTGCADPTRAGQVYGTSHLHVADASLASRAAGGHPIATVMAVADKVARDMDRMLRPAAD